MVKLNVKLLVNNINVTPINIKLKKEGERAIDQLELEVAPNVSVSPNNEIQYLQDMASLDNLSAIYNFQSNVKDESGNGNHGTASNITYNIDSWDGSSAYFNGTASNISVPDSNSLDLSGEFDVFIWASWSSTSNGILLQKTSGNPFQENVYQNNVFPTGSQELTISVNDTTAGDVKIIVGEGSIISSTAGYNDNTWHLIRIKRDSNNLITLYIDGISKGTVTNDSDLTNTSAMFFGSTINNTVYYNGFISRIRIYKGTNLTDTEANNIYTRRNSRSTMKFGGLVTKIDDETNIIKIIAQSFGKVLGETEIRGVVYDDKTPEFIVEDLITNNTNFNYVGNGGATGITLSKYTADGKLIDIIKDFAALTNRMFYTTALKDFVFEPIEFNETSISFIHGVDTSILESGHDDTQIVNELTVLGENLRYRTIETLTGDGSTTKFTLSRGAISTLIKIDGTEKIPENDYELDTIGKEITFTTAPINNASIEVDYTYESPLYIQGRRQSSIDTYGIHSKRLNLPWINNRADGIRFVQSYLNRYKDIQEKVKVEIPNIYNSIQENDIILLINTNSNISGSYVIKSIEWKYPEFNTVLNVGEYYFDYFEYDREIVRKLHDVEGALTIIKEIRDYESPEEVLTIGDNIITIDTNDYKYEETLNIVDTPVIYEKTSAVYGSSKYGSRTTQDVYGGI